MATTFEHFANRKIESYINMYKCGMSCEQIGKHFGVSRQSVWALLHKRTEMRSNKKYKEDNHFYRGGNLADDHAQNIVEYAVKTGNLKRPEKCEHCGQIPKPMRDGRSRIQAHHCDYNKPLDVTTPTAKAGELLQIGY